LNTCSTILRATIDFGQHTRWSHGKETHTKGNSLIEKELLMIAQGRTLKLLRLTGIVGIITGIATSIADISLHCWVMGRRQVGPFMAALPASR
jgi:hypothetical protein